MIEIAGGILLALSILALLPIIIPLAVLAVGVVVLLFVGHALHQQSILLPVLAVAGVFWLVAWVVAEIGRYRAAWRKRKEARQ